MALTLTQLRTRVLDPIDMNDLTIVDETEVNRYINQGIKVVSAAIHNLYEDYYLDKEDLTLVNGTRAYDLPADIYADKIRKIMYNDGNNDEYEISRVKYLELIKHVNDTSDADAKNYQYIITNNLTNGRKIQIYPTPSENLVITDGLWYIRNAKQLSLDADILDIPDEFENVVILYAQKECLKKDLPNVSTQQQAEKDYQEERVLMIETLSNRQPDKDTLLPMDLGLYEDFYGNGDGDWN